MPGEAEFPRIPRHEPSEPDALDPPPDEKAARHVAGRRLALSISSTMGTTESPTIARMTRVKFERTAGMFPKKYPASVNSAQSRVSHSS